MAAPTIPRPGLEAYKESITLPFAQIVSRLAKVIGRKLTAYVANVKDVRSVSRWMEGNSAYGNTEERLRLTFQVVQTLSEHDSPKIIQAWLMGVNPELGDRIPLRVLREGDPHVIGAEVLGAARAYIAGG